MTTNYDLLFINFDNTVNLVNKNQWSTMSNNNTDGWYIKNRIGNNDIGSHDYNYITTTYPIKALKITQLNSGNYLYINPDNDIYFCDNNFSNSIKISDGSMKFSGITQLPDYRILVTVIGDTNMYIIKTYTNFKLGMYSFPTTPANSIYRDVKSYGTVSSNTISAIKSDITYYFTLSDNYVRQSGNIFDIPTNNIYTISDPNIMNTPTQLTFNSNYSNLVSISIPPTFDKFFNLDNDQIRQTKLHTYDIDNTKNSVNSRSNDCIDGFEYTTNDGMCYRVCPTGYHKRSGDVVSCWGNCKDNDVDVGDLCRTGCRDGYRERSDVGAVAGVCYYGDLTYSLTGYTRDAGTPIHYNCPRGGDLSLDAAGSICITCPDGYHTNPLDVTSCHNNNQHYDRGIGISPDYGPCDTNGLTNVTNYLATCTGWKADLNGPDNGYNNHVCTGASSPRSSYWVDCPDRYDPSCLWRCVEWGRGQSTTPGWSCTEWRGSGICKPGKTSTDWCPGKWSWGACKPATSRCDEWEPDKCWATKQDDCPSGWTNVAGVCWEPVCKRGEQYNCSPGACKPGVTRYNDCPSGWRTDIATCWNPNGGICTDTWIASTNGGAVTRNKPKTCKSNRTLQDGMCYEYPRDGYNCAVTSCDPINPLITINDSMKYPSSPYCPQDKTNENGLCYNPCPTGYNWLKGSVNCPIKSYVPQTYAKDTQPIGVGYLKSNTMKWTKYISYTNNGSTPCDLTFINNLYVKPSNLTLPNNLPVTNGLLAFYNANSFQNNIWYDLTNNNNHAVNVTGTINYDPTNTFIYGNIDSSILFPCEILPPEYTIFHICKYNGTNNGSILYGYDTPTVPGTSESSYPWYSGFNKNKSGIACHGVTLTEQEFSIFKNNWVFSTDSNLNYRANSNDYTINTKITPRQNAGFDQYPDNVSLPSTMMYNTYSQLCINNNLDQTDNSDWACACIIVFNRTLSISEIILMENWIIINYNDLWKQTFSKKYTQLGYSCNPENSSVGKILNNYSEYEYASYDNNNQVNCKYIQYPPQSINKPIKCDNIKNINGEYIYSGYISPINVYGEHIYDENYYQEQSDTCSQAFNYYDLYNSVSPIVIKGRDPNYSLINKVKNEKVLSNVGTNNAGAFAQIIEGFNTNYKFNN